MRLLRRRKSPHPWLMAVRQTNPEFEWRFICHVDPPPVTETERGLIFYLGPNHYPAGLYLPKGYNIETRDGDDPGWTIVRARDCLTEQILTMWVLPPNEDGQPKDPIVQEGEQ